MTAIVGVQGGKGSYHEQAARQHFGPGAQIAYLHTFRDVFDALSAGEITDAVIAIANNRYGFVTDAFSELMRRHQEVSIRGEVYVRIKHQLLGVPGATIRSITEVYSQGVALGQCSEFLASAMPKARLIESEDTARSAEFVATSADKHKAAVASAQAAEIYGLDVIGHDIQDEENNMTRFLVMGANKTRTRQAGNKTTALLNTSQHPGALVDALLPFKKQKINISTLHSTFLPNTGFEMQFLVEFDAGMQEPAMQAVMSQLTGVGAKLTAMGTYRAQQLNIDSH